MNFSSKKGVRKGSYYRLIFLIIALSSVVIRFLLPNPPDVYFTIILAFVIGSVGFMFGIYIDTKDSQEEINNANQVKLSLIQNALSENLFQAEVLDKRSLYEKLSNSVRNAKNSIYLTALQDSDPREDYEDFVNHYYQAVEHVMKNSTVSLRHIFNIPDEDEKKLLWVDDLLNDFKSNTHLRFRYIDNLLDFQPLNIQIIDKREVYIISSLIHSGADDFSYKSLRFENQEIASFFTSYYNQIWESCKNNTLLDRGDINKEYFAKRKPFLKRCYKIESLNGHEGLQIQFSPLGKTNEKNWSDIYQIIKTERTHLSTGEREIRRRYEDGKAAIVTHNDEIVSHSSLISLFSPNDSVKLLGGKTIDYELFEFVGGWTKKDDRYRKKGLNKKLKNDLISVHTSNNPNCIFIDCSRNKASAYMHLGMGWKILPWDKYAFVTALIGFIEDKKFISRYGIMECGDALFYNKEDITIDTVNLFDDKEWNNFHFMVRDEEKVKFLNEKIRINNGDDLINWKRKVKSELFYWDESKSSNIND